MKGAGLKTTTTDAAVQQARFTRTFRPRSRPALVQACSTAPSLRLFSPSKVNLFLRILRKRQDKYHDLASLFHVIDFGDDIDFELTEARQDSISCTQPDVPTDDRNLVDKAFKLFRRHTGVQQCFRAHITKRVPAGGGIGGGSGNAATAMWAANELTGRPATNADLLVWSGEIGSDISIFFSNGAAYCTGRGEIVEPLDPPLPMDTPMLLIKPAIGLSTPEIFKAFDISCASNSDPRQLLDAMRSSGMNQDLCINDLERPAFKRLPQLQELKERLQRHGAFHAVFMSGSGSTIVCYGSDNRPAFLAEAGHDDVLVQPTRLMSRSSDVWYHK